MLGDLFSWLPLGLPAFLFVITVVVFFHELGHFAMARACGVAVETFSIGFGPAIFAWTDRKGTQWKISWVPLGGYVKFAGDADAASTPDRERIAQMTAEEQETLFQQKPVWKRALVVAAGPLANFILALAIFAGIYAIAGQEIVRPVIGAVDRHGAGAAAGLRPDDTILSVAGKPIASYGEFDSTVALGLGQPITLEVLRSGKRLTLAATPKLETVPDGYGGTEQLGTLGVTARFRAVIGSIVPGSAAEAAGLQIGDRIVSANQVPVSDFQSLLDVIGKLQGKRIPIVVMRHGERVTVIATLRGREFTDQSGKTVTRGFLGIGTDAVATLHYGPIGALRQAANQVWFVVDNTLSNVARMIAGHQDTRQLTGPIGIARVSEQVAATGFWPLLTLAAFISVSIGLVNLFPVPILDGGHLLYYAFEVVLGRPLGARAQDIGFRLGLAVMLGLMVLATWNDLVRLNLF